MRKLHKTPVVVGLLGLLLSALLLELLVDAGWIMELVIPRPSDTILAFPDVQADMDLFGNFLVTLGMTAASTFLALAIGIPFGYFLYRNTRFGIAYEGWLAAAFAAPTVLLYPLFLVIFGRSHATLIAMGFIPGSIPIIIQTRQGLLGVSKTLLNVGQSFNVSDRDMFWKIQLPSAVPTIFTGIRIGVMYTLVNIVAIEYLIDFGGLGRIVSEMFFRFDTPGTYASIIAVVLVSVLFYWGFGRVEKWLRPA
ncbi:MAG: ABC transporter permease subunit [Pseudomonadota bacterium]|nr:ABC transporter permease subunit [Pseudomonadota bacterium]